jgi:hypothetical protein
MNYGQLLTRDMRVLYTLPSKVFPPYARLDREKIYKAGLVTMPEREVGEFPIQ